MELECQLEEWKARDVLRGQSVGVVRIPPNVNKDIVLKCIAKEDKKYNPDEPPFLLPPTLTKETLMALNPQTDTLKLFHLWNNVSSCRDFLSQWLRKF